MAELDRILALVKTTTGVDFTQYRDSTIGRRVERRAALLAPAGLADYARLLEQEPTEVQALYQDLLINVTSFFRDPEVFEALKRVAFPALLAGTTRSTPIRLWVPDRKSTRLNSSHGYISYAVFCLKKKKKSKRSICLAR